MMTVRRSPLLLALSAMPVTAGLATCVAPTIAQTQPSAPPPQSGPPPIAALPAPPPAVLSIAPDIVLDGAARPAQGALLRGHVRPTVGRLTLDGVAVPVAPDGRFLIGFDRDSGPSAVLRYVPDGGGAPIERMLTVQAGQWAIQHINTPARGAAASTADYNRRRPGEIAQMAAARRTVVTSEGWRQDFVWPLNGRISGVFGSQRVYQGQPGSFHNGVDIAMPAGTPYVAPADGVVILAASEPFTLEGYLLMIDHGMGLSSVFLHSSRLDVRTGDVVRQGQRLGAVGATGRATGPHLHWAMRWNGAKVDAAQVAGPMAGQASRP